MRAYLIANALSRDTAENDGRPVPRRLVCRFDDHAVFAYARGRDLVRRSDDVLWAHVAGDVVFSARSGEPLAYVVGNVFYETATQLPGYYFIDTESVCIAGAPPPEDEVHAVSARPASHLRRPSDRGRKASDDARCRRRPR
jgi:hypothetical protein